MTITGRFPWGKVLDRFSYDFDGTAMEVTKFHPWKVSLAVTVRRNNPDTTRTHYHCEELRSSFDTLDGLLICWIAQKRLGLNQSALVTGVCKALNVHP